MLAGGACPVCGAVWEAGGPSISPSLLLLPRCMCWALDRAARGCRAAVGGHCVLLFPHRAWLGAGLIAPWHAPLNFQLLCRNRDSCRCKLNHSRRRWVETHFFSAVCRASVWPHVFLRCYLDMRPPCWLPLSLWPCRVIPLKVTFTLFKVSVRFNAFPQCAHLL